MSNALALAGVTAVLQYYFTNLYLNVAGSFPSTVTVSCLAPDQVQKLIENSTPDSENQVNLFMHQVTHNAAWRNVDLASMSADGKRWLTSPPLALDLHYLLTVYGSEYWQAEALLGYALMMMHQAPVLTRADIANAITMLTNPPFPATPPYPGNTLTAVLNTTGLADQIEMIKITPESMSREELAWLWTALKADYRPTFPFRVSVVLLQPVQTTSLALPVVLRPNPQAVTMSPAQILAVQPPTGKTAAQPGDPVIITGEFLSGAARVSLSNARYGVQFTIPVTSQANSVSFSLPADTTGQYPAGVYDLAVQFMDPTNTLVQQTTNTLPFAVAPALPATQTATTAASGSTGLMVTINGFSPQIWEGQDVVLALSTLTAPYISASAQAQPFVGPPGSPAATTLSFLFDNTLPTSTGLVARLLVDGVTSALTVNPSSTPPFVGPMVTL